MKLTYLAVLAAFFLGNGATETKSAPADEPAAPVIVADQTNEPALVQPVEAPVVAPEAAAKAPKLPSDMRVFVKSKGGQLSIVVIRLGHLVTLAQGDQRVFGTNEVSLPLSGAAPIVWETSHRKTLDTLRGEVEWEGKPGASTAWLRAQAELSPVRRVSSAWHDCRAFDGLNGAISLLCRIDSFAAGAARVLGDKPQQGIHMIALDAEGKKFFRMELETGKDGADAVVLGYSEGGRGHVIRAEASLLPGETKPSFALLETSRAQPIVFRRIRHPHHRHPIDHDFF